MITAGRVRELLHYDQETGVFRWLVTRSRLAKAGSAAGTINKDGYRRIRIDGRDYMAQRLAWLYMTGSWPANKIDHKNGVPGDDRWKNLREASNAQNSQNARRPRDNTSGFKGVCWNKASGKWMAAIRVNGHKIYLGLFTDINEAAAAYAVASKKHHGVFGRVA